MHKDYLAKKRNCRDLSYLVTPDGYRLKEGLFFRSANLYKLDKKARALYERLGLKTILDLRTEGEIMKKPDETLPEAASYSIPVLTAETLGITHERGIKAYKAPPDMFFLYRSIVTSDHSVVALGEALKKIFTAEGPRLWHCTAGKDRAGIVSAIFLKALGYREEDIIADYYLSDKPNRKRGRKYRFLITCFLFRPKIGKAVYKALLADPAYLKEALKAMEEESGSFEAYLHERLGISEEDVTKFKERYMVKA